MKFLSVETLGKHRFKTPEGYLICTDAIIARTGKQQYKKNELFEDSEDDDDTVIDVDRPSSEVFSLETIASFENKSLVDEHPDEDVNIENHKDLSKGYIRDVHKGIDNGQEVLMANIVVTDPDVISEIESGDKTELSCGYDCKIMKDNKGNFFQSMIRGNHVALCETGRAGNARIQDSINDSKVQDNSFKKQKIKDSNSEKIANKIEQIVNKYFKEPFKYGYFDIDGNAMKKEIGSISGIKFVPKTYVHSDECNLQIEYWEDDYYYLSGEIGYYSFNSSKKGTVYCSIALYRASRRYSTINGRKSQQYVNISKDIFNPNPSKDSIQDEYIQDNSFNKRKAKDEKFIFTVHYKNGKIKQETINSSNYYEALNTILKRNDVDSVDDINDSAVIDTDEPEVDKLIGEENEAVNSYETAMNKTNHRQNKQVYNHILSEELEHIEELENLKNDKVEDKLDNKPIKVVVKFESKEEADDAIKYLHQKEDFLNSKQISNDTIEINTTDLLLEKLKKILRLYFTTSIKIKDSKNVDLFTEEQIKRLEDLCKKYNLSFYDVRNRLLEGYRVDVDNHNIDIDEQINKFERTLTEDSINDGPKGYPIKTENRKINQYKGPHNSRIQNLSNEISEYLKTKNNKIAKSIKTTYDLIKEDYESDLDDVRNNRVNATESEVKAHYEKVNKEIRKLGNKIQNVKPLDSISDSKEKKFNKILDIVKLINKRR